MKLFKLFALVAIVTSCSISQDFYFNKDFSGNYKMTFDMSSLMAMAGTEEDETEEILDQAAKDSIALAYNSIDGISNTKVNSEDYIIFIAYDFENLDALNNAIAETALDGESDDATTGMLANSDIKFSGKGKKMTYHIPEFTTYDIEDSTMMYFDMIDMKSTFSFEREVKSIDNTSATIQTDGKTVIIEGSFKEFAEGDKTMSTEFKLK